MNLFTGLSDNEIISFFLSGAVFTAFSGLVAHSLYAFWVASKPIGGRVRTAAVWHFVALQFFMMSIITAVWSAPAEKSFVASDNDHLLDLGRFFSSLGDAFTQGNPTVFFGSENPNARLIKVVIGLVFAGAGLGCMLIGARRGGAQKRRIRDQSVDATPVVAESAGSLSAARS